MNDKNYRNWLAGTVAGVVLSASLALGQYRVDEGGRALDASNRVGSGGLNEPIRRDPVVTGQDIVTGNVTAGREFRDFVPYTDPQEFRGFTAGRESDRFIRDTAGAPTPLTPRADLTVPQPFYGEGRATPPPEGFVRQGFVGGYVPAQPQPVPGTADDMRIISPLDAPMIGAPRPGQLVLQGPLDPEDQQPTLLTASPLYGIRQWRVSDEVDRYFIYHYTPLGRERAVDRLRLDAEQMQRLRDEVRETIVPEPDPEIEEGQPMARTLRRPFDAPVDPRLPAAELRGDVAPELVPGELGIRQEILDRFRPPALTPQVAELRQRLERYDDYREHMRRREDAIARQPVIPPDVLADPTLPGVFDPEQMLRPDAPRPDDPDALPRPPLPGVPPVEPVVDPEPEDRPQGIEQFGIPDYARISRELVEEFDVRRVLRDPPEADDRPQRPEPLPITTLAEGVRARGLADLLEEAERLMKEGRFTSALDQYEAAEQVAPGNPLIILGRAHAELGAGYYARAERNLRTALSADRSLLMGRYDFEEFFGEERVQFLIEDLSRIAQAEPRQPRPLVLLAYISHNIGDERRALAYLDLAERRVEQRDPFHVLLREHWLAPGDHLEEPPASQPQPQPAEEQPQP